MHTSNLQDVLPQPLPPEHVEEVVAAVLEALRQSPAGKYLDRCMMESAQAERYEALLRRSQAASLRIRR